MSASAAEKVYRQAKCVATAGDVDAAIARLAQKINREYVGRDPILICVMNGGLYFSVALGRYLSFPFSLDYLHVTRYQETVPTDSVVWKAMPQLPLQGRDVLILDDVLDEGKTLLAIQEALARQQPASIETAVLAVKEHKRCLPGVSAAFSALTVPDTYLFGCGMDYCGYYRNLEALYAVRSEGV